MITTYIMIKTVMPIQKIARTSLTRFKYVLSYCFMRELSLRNSTWRFKCRFALYHHNLLFNCSTLLQYFSLYILIRSSEVRFFKPLCFKCDQCETRFDTICKIFARFRVRTHFFRTVNCPFTHTSYPNLQVNYSIIILEYFLVEKYFRTI